jgi:hypothetical protein
MTDIKQNAQKIVWECERQERLQKILGDIAEGKYIRLKLEGLYQDKDIFLKLEDLNKESVESIISHIKVQVKNNLRS